jgi:hypothetical protein
VAINFQRLCKTLERELFLEDEAEAELEAEADASCSGWESDPQSFSVVAAKHYLRKLWQPRFSIAKVVVTSPPPRWKTSVSVNVGAGLMVITVTIIPASRMVLVESDSHMACPFNYRCQPSGKLVLDEIACPTF